MSQNATSKKTTTTQNFVELEKSGKKVKVFHKKPDLPVLITGVVLGAFGSLGTLFRKDWRGFLQLTTLTLLVYAFLTFAVLDDKMSLMEIVIFNFLFWTVYWIAMSKFYTRLRLKNLIAAGYRPVDEKSEKILKGLNIKNR